MISLFVSPECSNFQKMVDFKVWMIRKNIQYSHITVDPSTDPEEFRKQCEGSERIVIVGGIGTMNTVVNATRSLGITYGLIPVCKRSDIGRALRLTLMDDEELFTLVATGGYTEMDAWEANGHLFFLAAVMGVSSIKGKYHIDGDDLVFTELLKKPFSGANTRIKSPTGEAYSHMSMLAVLNAGTIGGSLIINRQSRIDDGILDAVCVRKATLVRTILNKKAMDGQGLSGQSNVDILRSDRFTITCDSPQVFLIDGIGYEFDRLDIAPAGKIKFVANIRRAGNEG